jgi:uncharacterized protein (DUF362 family)
VLLVTDLYTGFIYDYYLKTHTSAELFDCIKNLFAYLKNQYGF